MGHGEHFRAEAGAGWSDAAGSGGGFQPGAGDPGPAQASQTPAEFYSARLGPAERLLFEQALKLEGLDQEVALLRLRIRQDLDDPKGLMRGIDLLVKALRTRYRLGPDRSERIYQAIVEVLQGLGEGLDGPAGAPEP
ncbi:MAG: hypothetical protein C4315_05865 [Chloroflexota bacterium]